MRWKEGRGHAAREKRVLSEEVSSAPLLSEDEDRALSLSHRRTGGGGLLVRLQDGIWPPMGTGTLGTFS